MTEPGEVIWPVSNTLVHTRGAATEVAVRRLDGKHVVLTLRIGDLMDVTLHCHHQVEIISILDQLKQQVREQLLEKEPK